MPKGVRIALGIVVGLFAGGGSLALIEMAGHSMVAGSGLFAVVAAGQGAAALIGGLIANAISKQPWSAWCVGGLFLAISLINVFSFAHPIWFVPAAATAIALGAFFATRWVGAAKPSPM